MAQQPDTSTAWDEQVTAGAEWLDDHFEMSRPEYEDQLRAVGIQSGWHVLDAGSGSGSFLPWMAELVGPSGRLSALDVAPENVALVERRVANWQFPCPVEARVGTVIDLPYPDNTFDAVWFANTSQYLTDPQLGKMLSEFRRVVRPGGLVAIKETDCSMLRVLPAPPGLMLRWFLAAAHAGNVQAAGALRAPLLPGWLRRAGLLNVWQRSTPIERTTPLAPAVRSYMRQLLSLLAGAATELDLPPADRQVWAQLRDPDALGRYLDDPDFSVMDINVLAIGTVPSEPGTSG